VPNPPSDPSSWRLWCKFRRPEPPIPPITHRATFDKSRPDRARSLARRSIATPSHLQSRTDGAILKCAVPDNRSPCGHRRTRKSRGQRRRSIKSKLCPHRLGAVTAYSRQLLAQSAIDVDNVIKDDILRVMAVAIDRAVLNGTGSANNQPTGILTVGANTVGSYNVNLRRT
jgi:hypothetical protein